MLQINTLIDLYIDANIVLLFAFLFWRLVQAGLSRSSYRRDYGLQLNLTEGAIIAVMLSPIVAGGLIALNAVLFTPTKMARCISVLNARMNGRSQGRKSMSIAMSLAISLKTVIR